MEKNENGQLTVKKHKKPLIFTLLIVSTAAMFLYYQWDQPLVPSMDERQEGPLFPNATNLKSILLWTKWFGTDYSRFFRTGKDIIVKQCKKHCVISRERSNPHLYDALVFHTSDINERPVKRTPNQIYIAYSMESPVKQKGHHRGGNFYNWSVSVLRKSTIQSSYFQTMRKPSTTHKKIQQPILKHQISQSHDSAVIMWVVSNCYAHSMRHLYVKQLQSYIPVDIFGYCGMKCPGRRADICYRTLAKRHQYKFYLAFENSVCKDYITEKPFKALMTGLVPIVLGGLGSDDYTQPGVLPPNSFIDVRNFSSPKELAQYLTLLNQNNTLYMQYHKWRSEYSITDVFDEWLCKVCDALYDRNITKPTSLDWDEFYDPTKLCDNQLVYRLLRKSSNNWWI